MSEPGGISSIDETLHAVAPATTPATVPASIDETLHATEHGPGSGRAPTVALEELERGTSVGRYVILSRIGSGGMGVVHVAYDPELDRRVALKLMHARGGGTLGDEGHRHLLREAQAMAKLSHPNVVTVHDVGEHQGRVYVAMEFVEGRTLADWRTARSRRWTAVLDVMLQAGRGLAAAHARGLEHRDFKPDNVMIGRDRRARVLDFGLARPTGAVELRLDMASDIVPRDAALMRDVVQDPGDSLIGTPAYMAPEQFLHGATDARADQFSFCVTLWEAVYGERPFAGDNVAALALSVSQGQLRAPPRSRAPGWLARVLTRGLSLDPDQRYPDMDALLAALEAGRRRARRRPWVSLGGAVFAIGAAVLGGLRWQHRARVAACEAEGAQLREGWTQARRDALAAGIRDADAPFAPQLVEHVLPWLDAQTQELASAYSTACLARDVDERWTDELHARAAWCLDARREELDALVDELTHADKEVLPHAVQAAAGLAPVGPCTDEVLLQRLPAPPSERREEIQAVRAQLSRARALRGAARFTEAAELTEAAVATAASLDSEALQSQAALELGLIQGVTAKYPEARESFERAYFSAARAGELLVMADAAIELTQITGYRMTKSELGQLWGRQAEVVLLGVGDDPLREAARLTSLATIHFDRAETDEGLARIHQALELQRERLGPDHPTVAKTLTNTGTLLHKAGRFEDAVESYEQGLDILRRSLGPRHPQVGHTLTALATSKFNLGQPEEALALHGEAVELLEAAFGSSHPALAMAYNNIGTVHQARGDWANSVPAFERAAAITAENLGPEHPNLAIPLTNLGIAELHQGRFAEAGEHFERARALTEAAFGAEHPMIAIILDNIASAKELTGEWDESRALYEQSIALAQTAFGSEHPTLGDLLTDYGDSLAIRGEYAEAKARYVRAREIFATQEGIQPTRTAAVSTGLADVELGLGNVDAALELAELALKQREGADNDPGELAQTRWTLGRARWLAGGDAQASARALIEQARDGFAEAGSLHARQLEAATAWLDSH